MSQLNFFGFREDCGGRRRIKDRRVLVSSPPGPECRTHWKRRNGVDRRKRSLRNPNSYEKRDVPENQPAARETAFIEN